VDFSSACDLDASVLGKPFSDWGAAICLHFGTLFAKSKSTMHIGEEMLIPSTFLTAILACFAGEKDTSDPDTGESDTSTASDTGPADPTCEDFDTSLLESATAEHVGEETLDCGCIGPTTAPGPDPWSYDDPEDQGSYACFCEAQESCASAQLRIILYTMEGDPVINQLVVVPDEDGSCHAVQLIDWSHDAFSGVDSADPITTDVLDSVSCPSTE
jgi:hypothetical protein